jgi:hypothetical protein
METFAYDVVKLVSAVMLASILIVVLSFTIRGAGKWGKYLKFLSITVGIISIEVLLFLSMYKEAFRLTGDIATSDAVNYYGSCMVMGVVSLLCNAIALVKRLRKQNQEEHNEKRHL